MLRMFLFTLVAIPWAGERFPGGMEAASKTELPHLSKVLQEGDWNARIHAVQRIGTLGKDGLAELRAAADDADWQVRLTAVHWLGRVGPPAIPALTQSLERDPCRVIRISAIHWLGSFGPKAAASLEITGDDESDVARYAGWYWLRRIDPETYQRKVPVTSPHEDLNACMRSASPLSLGREAVPGLPAAPPGVPGREDPISDKGTIGPAKMPEEVIARQALEKKERPPAEEERFAALDLILAGLPRPEETLPAAPERFRPEKKSEAALLLEAADTLGKPGPRLAFPKGPARLPPRQDKGETRALENRAVPRRHDPLPDLLIALKSHDELLQVRAADELGSRGEAAAEAVPDLIKALRDRSARVRASAALALGKIGRASDAGVPHLIRALGDKHPDVRYSASESLARIGTPAAQRAFHEYLREEIRRSLRDQTRP